MMKITDSILNIDGKTPIKDQQTGNPITYKTVFVNSILGGDANNSQSGEEKIRAYILAERIYKSEDKVDFNPKDIDLIVKQVEKFYGILIYVRTLEFFGREVKIPDDKIADGIKQ